MTVVDLADLGGLVGRDVATSDWLVVTQDRINAFADATGDHQWIHVDTERARAETPFGATIAHGFLTLSLLSALMRDALVVEGPRMTLNYGLNRVRFVSPVPSGSRIRARVALAGIDDTGDSLQATWSVTIRPRSDSLSSVSGSGAASSPLTSNTSPQVWIAPTPGTTVRW